MLVLVVSGRKQTPSVYDKEAKRKKKKTKRSPTCRSIGRNDMSISFKVIIRLAATERANSLNNDSAHAKNQENKTKWRQILTKVDC